MSTFEVPQHAPSRRPWLWVWVFALGWVLQAALVEGLLRARIAAFWVVLVDDGCRCGVLLAATAALHWRARHSPKAMAPLWRALFWAMALLSLATLYLIATMDLLALDAPVTTFRHLGYFGATLCLGWAVLQLPADLLRPTQRIQALLDGLLISLAIFFITWGVFLRKIVEENWIPGTLYGLTLSYCLLSVALASLWIYQESRMSGVGLGASGILLRLGIAIMLLWWPFYAIGNIQGWYRGLGVAQRADVLFSFRYLCFGLAALWPSGPIQLERRRRQRERQTFLPYLPPLLAMAYGAFLLLRGQSFDPTLLLTGVLLGLAMTLRQFLTVRDLDALSRDLELRVHQRTKALIISQQELVKAQRLRLISGMAAGFAHDFKNMLGIIATWVQLLREGDEPERRVRGYEAIDYATRQALVLVQEILAAGHLQELNPRPFDLGEHLRAHQADLAIILGTRGQLVLALGPGPLPVYMDPVKFQLALVNLASNAADAMEVAGVLTLRAWLDPVEPFTVLEVSDTGLGIEAGDLERIFDPFFTTKPTGKGTGLGLSSVHGTIHQSGGTVTVRSQPGWGTAFTLQLPLPTI